MDRGRGIEFYVRIKVVSFNFIVFIGVIGNIWFNGYSVIYNFLKFN